jgi:hypothetical protein
MPPRLTPAAASAAINTVLAAVPPGARLDLPDLLAAMATPGLTLARLKSLLDVAVRANPRLLESLQGYYPPADVIIDLVQLEIGNVVEANLSAANAACRRLVTSIGGPMIARFIRTSLGDHIDAGDQISISMLTLVQFMSGEFAEYMKAAGNGLVSLAGKLNEGLLVRAMENAGMVRPTHFRVTGTDSEGDIVVRSTTANLGVEVKSFHARERLLRGLQDVQQPKVGVGFFIDPLEFNNARTTTLLQANPAAIYMPTATLAQVDPIARGRITNDKIAVSSRLYRPLEQFVTDMAAFAGTGTLPHY